MMAQYYEVLSQTENNVEQVGQFFNNLEADQGVRYILTDDSQQQFRSQQLVVSSEQVMLVDGQSQQIQQVVIDQGQIAFQAQNQGQQFSIVQNTDVNNHQIFYMEANSNQQVERIVVEQPAMQQTQTSQAPQPIVLNHQLASSNSIIRTNRNPPIQHHPVGQTRMTVRQPHLQVGTQNRLVTPQTRPSNPINPQQLRPENNALIQQQARNPRVPVQQVRQPNANQPQRAAVNLQQKNQMTSLMNRQLPSLQLQQSSTTQIQQPQQVKQAPKPASGFQQQSQQQHLKTEEKEVDDNELVSLPDGTSVSLATYKKMIAEQKRNLAQRAATQLKTNQSQMEAPQSQALKRLRNPTPVTRKLPKGGTRPPRGGRPNVTFSAPQPRNLPPNQPRYPVNQQHQPQQAQQPQLQQQQQPQLQTQPQIQPPLPPQPQQQMKQYQNQMLPQRLQQLQPQGIRQSQINYLITPPQPNRPQQQRPLPAYIPSSQIQHIIENTPIAEEFSDSIRMLVLLENGEQRLITFTLPKEACTIQEILDQVNVPFNQDTNIQVTEANTNGINYIVTVGNVRNFDYTNEEDSQEPEVEQQMVTPVQPPPIPACPQPQSQTQLQPPPVPPLQPPPVPPLQSLPPEPPKSTTPDPPKELPKLVPGKLAVCSYCGITSEDFNRCTRCKIKLPENVKSLDAPSKNGHKHTDIRTIQQAQHQLPQISLKTLSGTLKPATPTKKRTSKPKVVEHEQSVVISSDEEEDEEKLSPRSVSEQLLKSLGASITLSPITKEPSMNEIKKHVHKASVEGDPANFVSMSVTCRTVRIGSYRFAPPEDVIINSSSIIIKGPQLENKNEIKTIVIDKSDIVKVLVSFSKALPVIFYYLNPAIAPAIRNTLSMKEDSDVYFDPVSEKEDSYKRITLLPEDFGEEHKNLFQLIYSMAPFNIMDELTPKEANDILLKTCPKDLTRQTFGSYTEIKKILEYPAEAKGRITINTEDYVCLAQDQFLNDVIIDFYLKYLLENLPNEQQHKVHVFSTFFYKRLTTKPSGKGRKSQPTESDPNLTAAQKRHARVQKWTKNVNLFEKDFIVVPINENAHWFLAIICFPALNGCQTFDGQPYKVEPRQKPSTRKKKITLSIGNISVTAVKKEKPIICEDPELSDKDEAEGDESELDSEDSEEIPLIPPPLPARVKAKDRPPLKQPCILIFDSLAGASRTRVVATLRDYLTCEYKAKLNQERIYTKEIIKGACPKVPQQTNFTDCGLYLLQYVEQFFKDPIKDFHMPISTIKNWFDELTVTKKREDIANLIKSLMQENGKDIKILPDILFPTLNGKIVERPDLTEEEDDEEEEDMFTDIEDSHMTEPENGSENSTSALDTSGNEETATGSAEHLENSPLKPSVESVSDKGDVVAQTINNPNLLKPDLSEFPRQSNRDTLSYLKAKRIIRHKNSDGPIHKKVKVEMERN